MSSLPLLIGLLSAPDALATPLPFWSYDAFPGDAPLSGVDGWESSYPEDTWIGLYGEPTLACPLTDDVAPDCGSDWSGACNNHLSWSGATIRDGVFSAGFITYDDDAPGFLFGRQSADDHLLLVFCGANAGGSCPVDSLDLPAVAILHVHGGAVDVLSSLSGGYEEEVAMQVTIAVNEGRIHATWGEADAGTDSSIEAVMPDERPMTGIGFYAYDAGAADGTYLAFFSPVLEVFDEDNDGVYDDIDNCQRDPNADQADLDQDGVGTRCDPGEEAPADSDPPDSGDSREAVDEGGPVEDKAPADIQGGCSCAAAANIGGSGLLGLLPLGLAVRRRVEQNR